MTNWNLLVTALTLLWTLGLAALSFLVMKLIVTLSSNIWKRHKKTVFDRVRDLRYQDERVAIEESGQAKGVKRYLKAEYVIVVVTILGVFVARDAFISTIIVIAGTATFFIFNKLRFMSSEEYIYDDLETIIMQLRSRLPVTHSQVASIKHALEELPKTAILSRVLRRVVDRLEMKESHMKACEPLFDLPYPIVQRLGNALAWGAQASEDIQLELLGSLLEEVRYQKGLRNQIKQTSAMIRGTIRVLQGAAIAGFGIAIAMPLWRDYFFVDMPHRVLFVLLFLMSVSASLYFEYEMIKPLRGDAT